MHYKVLIADDNKSVLENFKEKLSNHLDIEPKFVDQSMDVLSIIQKEPYEYAVVVLDYYFEGQSLNGAQIAEQILKINPNLIVLICTGDVGREAPISCLKAGVTDFIQKDEPLEQIIKKIRLQFKKFDELARVVTNNNSGGKNHIENSSLISKIGMVGCSQSMASLAQQILSLSQNGGDGSTVLIRGESGTGKELIAKAIHKSSSRSSRQLLCINCAAIPENLLESELFGHEKGAFTGANQKRIGKFQNAIGGTIFLDEIGEMPKTLQAKLLRILQEKTIEPVGSNKTIHVDVRIIAATHVDLESKIESGDFREDLFYRLNQIPLTIPALRERPEDIAPLVRHFIGQKSEGQRKRLMYKTLQYLQRYSWSGNVRELENMVNRLVILNQEDEIRPDHLDAKVFNHNRGEATSYTEFKTMMEKKEKEFIISKIQDYSSLREAAKALCIPNSSLQRKLADWGYSFKMGEIA